MCAKNVLHFYSKNRMIKKLQNEIIKLKNEIELSKTNIHLLIKNKQKEKNKRKEIHNEINLKKEIIKETEYELEKIEKMDVNDNDIIEEDWLNMFKFYSCIEKLKTPYKDKFEKIKHLRNEKILDLLDKINNESRRMMTYMNDKKTEYPTKYWSNLCIEDFNIL